MPSGNSQGRRKTKRNGCSEHCVTKHEGFRSVCLDRWCCKQLSRKCTSSIAKTVEPMDLHTILLSSPYSLTCGCLDFIQISNLSYLDTMLHGSQPTGKIVLRISGKEFKFMLSSCAVNYIRIELPYDHYAAIVFIIF